MLQPTSNKNFLPEITARKKQAKSWRCKAVQQHNHQNNNSGIVQQNRSVWDKPNEWAAVALVPLSVFHTAIMRNRRSTIYVQQPFIQLGFKNLMLWIIKSNCHMELRRISRKPFPIYKWICEGSERDYYLLTEKILNLKRWWKMQQKKERSFK